MTPSEDPPKLRDYERPELPFERKAQGPPTHLAYASVGIEFGLIVALFFLGGRFLDGKFETAPWLAAGGALLGIALGMYRLIRGVLRLQERDRGESGTAGKRRSDS